jgi:hypothetical protein
MAANRPALPQPVQTATQSLLQPTYTMSGGLSIPTNVTGRPVQTGQNAPTIAVSSAGIATINGNSKAAQIIAGGTGITVASSGGTTTISATGGGGTVTSVTASGPLASSGGSTPNISIASPIPISDGGTGTTTPGDIAGTGISITGSFPNQTITNTSPSSGGTVTAVTASSPLASSGGTTPNISISTPVPIVDGGTGTTTPALVAGTGISVTGSWPDQTITNTSPSSGGTVTSVTQTVPSIFTITGSPITTAGTLAIGLTTEAAMTVWAGPVSGAAATPTFRALTATDIPALSYVTAVTGSGNIASSGGTNPNITFTGLLPIANGGTATATPSLVAGTGISVTGSFPNQTVTNTSPSSGGTVTAVTASGPLASSGGTTPNISLSNEAANLALAGPASGSAAAPTFRSLVGADLPNPSATTLGGIESFVAVGSKWINAISTLGVPSATQPAFTDISGTASVTQGGTGLASYTTGDILYASAATTVAGLHDVAAGAIVVSGGVGAAPAYSSSPTIKGTVTMGAAGKALVTDDGANGYLVSPGSLYFQSNSGAGASFGQFTAANGDLVLGRGGISFNTNPEGGTQLTLNDYEKITYTPTDTSGAGLTLTVSYAFCYKLGRFTYVNAQIAYPATVSTANSSISLAVAQDGTGGAGLAVAFTTLGSYYSPNANGANVMLFNTAGGNVKNATLSGQFISFSGVYMASS